MNAMTLSKLIIILLDFLRFFCYIYTSQKLKFDSQHLFLLKIKGILRQCTSPLKSNIFSLIRNYKEIYNFILCHLLMSRSCRNNIKHLLYIYICNTNRLIKKCMCLLKTKYYYNVNIRANYQQNI